MQYIEFFGKYGLFEKQFYHSWRKEIIVVANAMQTKLSNNRQKDCCVICVVSIEFGHYPRIVVVVVARKTKEG